MMPQERLIPFARYYVSSCAFDSTGKRNWSCRSMHQERKIPKKRFVNRSACYAFICRLLKSTSTEIAEPDFTLLIDAIVSQVHPSAVPAVVSRTMRSADSVRLWNFFEKHILSSVYKMLTKVTLTPQTDQRYNGFERDVENVPKTGYFAWKRETWNNVGRYSSQHCRTDPAFCFFAVVWKQNEHKLFLLSIANKNSAFRFASMK